LAADVVFAAALLVATTGALLDTVVGALLDTVVGALLDTPVVVEVVFPEQPASTMTSAPTPTVPITRLIPTVVS
jgi:hypothetical protein